MRMDDGGFVEREWARRRNGAAMTADSRSLGVVKICEFRLLVDTRGCAGIPPLLVDRIDLVDMGCATLLAVHGPRQGQAFDLFTSFRLSYGNGGLLPPSTYSDAAPLELTSLSCQSKANACAFERGAVQFHDVRHFTLSRAPLHVCRSVACLRVPARVCVFDTSILPIPKSAIPPSQAPPRHHKHILPPPLLLISDMIYEADQLVFLVLLDCLSVCTLTAVYFLLIKATGKLTSATLDLKFANIQYPTALAFLSTILSLLLAPLLARISMVIFWDAARQGVTVRAAEALWKQDPLGFGEVVFRRVPGRTRFGVVLFIVLFVGTNLVGTFLQSSLSTTGRIYYYAFPPDVTSADLGNADVGQGTLQNLAADRFTLDGTSIADHNATEASSIYTASTAFAGVHQQWDFITCPGAPTASGTVCPQSVPVALLINTTCTPVPPANNFNVGSYSSPRITYTDPHNGSTIAPTPAATLSVNYSYLMSLDFSFTSGNTVYPFSCNFSVGNGTISNDPVTQINVTSFEPFTEHYVGVDNFFAGFFVLLQQQLVTLSTVGDGNLPPPVVLEIQYASNITEYVRLVGIGYSLGVIQHFFPDPTSLPCPSCPSVEYTPVLRSFEIVCGFVAILAVVAMAAVWFELHNFRVWTGRSLGRLLLAGGTEAFKTVPRPKNLRESSIAEVLHSSLITFEHASGDPLMRFAVRSADPSIELETLV
ncbi:hypothetical protein BDK51DRAFT_48846 [Blyttiomyces helicus]|uniref:Uncharacterized protein n=1 Tax=Blyttiomyces helicus TaxID=388810 RepID=A0A4P9WLI9_9FUNG|nr:hypothetical protein BDK51DRAFT_48846 [Blyttiomyces helicus]|eukprot:RKO93744.1 hypothetical protein BDK51DRAFT_48846 [Blyttiomyces helicus]